MMRRRELITLLSGAAAWPLAARARPPAMPVIGFVYTGNTSSEAAPYVSAFHQGLKELGFVEGQNIATEYRWPGTQYDQLPALMAELVRRRAAVIVGNTPPSMAAKAATSTIPIVFFTGTDPVKVGLVASFNRPDGNATGVSFLSSELEAKRLGLLRELLPQAKVIAALVDAKFIAGADQLRDLQVAGSALGQQIRVVEAGTEGELENAFANLAQQRPDVLIVAAAPFFTGRRNRIVELVARQSLPAMYDVREFPVAGGLISYGANITDAIRRVGVYTGRILKGEKPADLPVLQPTKFELVINAKTAKALGLDVPYKLLAIADEVIE
jgi:putative tryptophan/tyrosine transport system substrate-binding protein